MDIGKLKEFETNSSQVNIEKNESIVENIKLEKRGRAQIGFNPDEAKTNTQNENTNLGYFKNMKKIDKFILPKDKDNRSKEGTIKEGENQDSYSKKIYDKKQNIGLKFLLPSDSKVKHENSQLNLKEPKKEENDRKVQFHKHENMEINYHPKEWIV